MIIERTRDIELIRQIMTHPKIYPFSTDDFCPPADEFKPVDHEAVWYILVRHEDGPLGIFMFVPQNAICYDVHTCLLPKAWGVLAMEAAIKVREWMWCNSPVKRIVTVVPAYNRLALRFAECAGLKKYGVNPISFQKNGKLWDQILLGVSKPEVI